MAVTKSFTLAEEELSCPICFEDFVYLDKSRHPKLLMCLHTFCTACIETLRKHDGSLQCSICRIQHNIYRIGDLYDNYLICDYLRLKQESEDESLANQLRDEYNESIKKIHDQEKKDAQLAIEEERKARLEEELERAQIEADRIRRIEMREAENREKEQARLVKEAERIRLLIESERLRQLNEVERRLREEQTNNEEDETQFNDAEDSCSDNNAEDDDDAELLSINEDDNASEISIIEEVSDGSFQDFVDDDSEENESEALPPPPTVSNGIPDLDLEEIFHNNSDSESSQEVVNISSDEDSDEDESSEPDIFSEEFSGVSKANEKKTEFLPPVLPPLCRERDDGTIVALTDGKSEVAGALPRPPTRTRKNLFTSTPVSSSQYNLRFRSGNTEGGARGGENNCCEEVTNSFTDSEECIDIDSCSSTDESFHRDHTPRKSVVKDKKFRFAGSTRASDEENCEIQ